MISREKQDAIRALADEHGYVEPRDVVAAARKSDHPLHGDFDWNVKRAAEARWLDIASRLIRLVKIEIVINEMTVKSVGYVVDPDRPQKSRRYLDITAAGQNRAVAQQVILDEMARITAAVRRAQAVASVLGLRPQLDLLLENVTDVITAADQVMARTKASAKKRRGRPRRQSVTEEARV